MAPTFVVTSPASHMVRTLGWAKPGLSTREDGRIVAASEVNYIDGETAAGVQRIALFENRGGKTLYKIEDSVRDSKIEVVGNTLYRHDYITSSYRHGETGNWCQLPTTTDSYTYDHATGEWVLLSPDVD